MAKNLELGCIQRVLERAVATNDGKTVAQVRLRVATLLLDPYRSKAEKHHLRQLKRRTKKSLIIAQDELQRRLDDYEAHMSKARQIFASGIENWRRVSHASGLLADIRVFLSDLKDPIWVYYLSRWEAIHTTAPAWLEKQEGELAILEAILAEKEDNLPAPEKKRHLKLVRERKRKEQRKIENQRKSERHPRGKGKRGKRHQANHPFQQ